MKNILRNSIALLLLLITRSLQATNDASDPMIKPRTEGYLQISDKHRIFYATYGNPEGLPVVILHGGPGLGCDPLYTRFFDLEHWHIVMFDQRGAMRSMPFASMEENTTQHSVADIEVLRKHLGIEQWCVFGHSWGSCLALVYGQAHPEACLGFILEGIFLGRERDISFFREMGKISKSAYRELLTHLSEEEQTDISQACYRRIMDPNPEVHMKMARALMRYQMLNTQTPPNPEVIQKALSNERFILSFMRNFVHYAVHGCFLTSNQILDNMHQIAHLPAIIVHGSLDVVCLPEQAHLLHQQWQKSQLWMIEGAGHSCKEPAIIDALIKASNTFISCSRSSGG